ILPFVGSGCGPFSPNQSLCLPQLAPVPTGLSPLAFIVQGVEPGARVDSEGTVYVVSIRGVPGGVDLWRWNRTLDGPPNSNGTLPFKYEGQPDNCGIYGFTNGGCANNVGSETNLGVAPGGGDADIAVNRLDPTTGTPNLPLTSLTLAPGVTGTHSTDRGDNFSPPNVPAAGTPNGTANLAAQIKIDYGSCPSRGNLYQLFIAPDNALENETNQPMRSAYIGVSVDAKFGLPAFTFTDYKVYTGPKGANNGNIFPALAVDQFGFLYAVWSDNSNIFFTSSSDLGKTWTPARVVNQGATVGKANVFPWVAADANGHVV